MPDDTVISITGNDFDSVLAEAKRTAKDVAKKKFAGELKTLVDEFNKAKATCRDTITLANSTLTQATEKFNASVAKIQVEFNDFKEIAV